MAKKKALRSAAVRPALSSPKTADTVIDDPCCLSLGIVGLDGIQSKDSALNVIGRSSLDAHELNEMYFVLECGIE